MENKIETKRKKNKNPFSHQEWYRMFLCMGIPIIGFFYLLGISKSKNETKRDFAKAYLKYKLVKFIAAVILLIILIWISIPYVDKLLAYIEML